MSTWKDKKLTELESKTEQLLNEYDKEITNKLNEIPSFDDYLGDFVGFLVTKIMKLENPNSNVEINVQKGGDKNANTQEVKSEVEENE